MCVNAMCIFILSYLSTSTFMFVYACVCLRALVLLQQAVSCCPVKIVSAVLSGLSLSVKTEALVVSFATIVSILLPPPNATTPLRTGPKHLTPVSSYSDYIVNAETRAPHIWADFTLG